MDRTTPALQVRTRFRSAFFGLPDGMEVADPKRYRAFLDAQLKSAREELAKSESGRGQTSPDAVRGAVFVIATGLSTFGQLEFAELGLQHMPTRGLVRRLAGSLHGFLPLPANIDPVRDPTAAAAWIRANRSRLRWVPESHYEWAD